MTDHKENENHAEQKEETPSWEDLRDKARQKFQDMFGKKSKEKSSHKKESLDKRILLKLRIKLDHLLNEKPKKEKAPDRKDNQQDKPNQKESTRKTWKDKASDLASGSIEVLRKRHKAHIEEDDRKYPKMPKSRFEETSEASMLGDDKKVERLMDYFGRTNRDPFQSAKDKKEIEIVSKSIDSGSSKFLKGFLENWRKNVDPAFAHADVKGIELISDIEMLNGNICTLGVTSSQDLANDVATRLETNKTKLDMVDKGTGWFISQFNKNKKRKFFSTVGFLGVGIIANPIFFGALAIPKAHRSLFGYLKSKKDQEAQSINSDRIPGLLKNDNLSALRALSLGKGHSLEINDLPKKMRWLEVSNGWCYLPSVKANNPNEELVYQNKNIIIKGEERPYQPKIIVQSPATWEIFFQQIGKKCEGNLPLDGKTLTEDIKAKGNRFYLPPDVAIVQSLDLEGVNDIHAKTLREIKGDITISSNEVLAKLPDGIICRGKLKRGGNLDNNLVKQKLNFVPKEKAKSNNNQDKSKKNKSQSKTWQKAKEKLSQTIDKFRKK